MNKKKLDLKEIGVKRLVIIGLCGLLLLVLSVPDLRNTGAKKETGTAGEESPSPAAGRDSREEYAEKMEAKLKRLLKKVEGIGDVDVMITLKTSGEDVTLKDEPTSQSTTNETDSAGGSRISSSLEKGEETVLIKSEKGDSVPYIVKELSPEVSGVVVIAQGGGDPGVVNEINNAIEVLFGIPVHKIKVMKMSDHGMNPG